MKTLKVLLQDVVSGLKAWVDTNTVHKSGNETIDGTKTFSAPQCYSSNAILFNSSVLPTQGQVPSATINPLRQYIGYGTSYPNSIFIHDTEMRTNGRNHYRWTIYSDDHSANAAMWLVYNPDSEYLRYLNLKGSCVPDANGTYHLGTPDYKWKTINGLNPGALSLPSESPSQANLDPTNWNTTGTAVNKFTPPTDGWLGVQVQSADTTNLTGQYVFAGRSAGGETFWPSAQLSNLVGDFESGKLVGCVMIPVIAGKEYHIRIKMGKTLKQGSKIYASFYPCLGNV